MLGFFGTERLGSSCGILLGGNLWLWEVFCVSKGGTWLHRGAPMAPMAIRSQDGSIGWSRPFGVRENHVGTGLERHVLEGCKKPIWKDLKGSPSFAPSFMVRSSAAERQFCGLEPVLIWTS